MRRAKKKLNSYEKFALDNLEESIIQEGSLVMDLEPEKVRSKLDAILDEA